MGFALWAVRAHTAGSHWAWCPPAPPDPFVHGCPSAPALPIYTCAWNHSIPGAELQQRVGLVLEDIKSKHHVSLHIILNFCVKESELNFWSFFFTSDIV